MKTLYIKTVPGAVEFYRHPDATAKTLVKRCATPYPTWASRKLIRHHGIMYRLAWIEAVCPDCAKPINASLMSGIGRCADCTVKWVRGLQ